MGTWGVGLFENDTACDVRSDFCEFVADGASPVAASQWLIDQWVPDDDPDEGPVVWLTLAALQSRVGWLDERVKQRALRIINDGSDLQGWIDEATERDVAERRAVLEKLKEQLLSPQPEPMSNRQIERLQLDLHSW